MISNFQKTFYNWIYRSQTCGHHRLKSIFVSIWTLINHTAVFYKKITIFDVCVYTDWHHIIYIPKLLLRTYIYIYILFILQEIVFLPNNYNALKPLFYKFLFHSSKMAQKLSPVHKHFATLKFYKNIISWKTMGRNIMYKSMNILYTSSYNEDQTDIDGLH